MRRCSLLLVSAIPSADRAEPARRAVPHAVRAAVGVAPAERRAGESASWPASPPEATASGAQDESGIVRRVSRGAGPVRGQRLRVRRAFRPRMEGGDEADGDEGETAVRRRQLIPSSFAPTREEARKVVLSRDEEVLLATRAQAGMALQRVADDLARELGRPPETEELAQRVGLSVDLLKQRQAHGHQAKQLMVEHNIRLVFSVANRYVGRGVDLSDLVQEGAAGLIRGLEKFDISKGFKFSTYVHWWIRQAVARAVAEHSRTVRLPTHVTDALARVRRASHAIGGGEPPSHAELGEAVGLPADRVRKLLVASRQVNSMDAELPVTGKAAGRPSALSDSVPAAVHPEEEYYDGEVLQKDLNDVLNTLDWRERNVLSMHFGLVSSDGDSMTRLDVGGTYNISAERVRQIEDVAMRKLRSPNRCVTLARHLNGDVAL